MILPSRREIYDFVYHSNKRFPAAFVGRMSEFLQELNPYADGMTNVEMIETKVFREWFRNLTKADLDAVYRMGSRLLEERQTEEEDMI